LIWSQQELESWPKEEKEQNDTLVPRILHQFSRAPSESQWPFAVFKDSLYESFKAYTSEHKRWDKGKDRAAFFKKLKDHLPSVQEERPRLGGKQVRVIYLPTLEAAREEFKRTSGLNLDFDSEKDDA
jgi:hypothetical protein